MLDSFVVNFENFDNLDVERFSGLLTHTVELDRQLITSLRNFLEPFKQFRVRLCLQKFPSCHYFLPICAKIQQHLQQDFGPLEFLKRRMQHYFQEKLLKSDNILYKCGTFLDPSLKNNRSLIKVEDKQQIFAFIEELSSRLEEEDILVEEPVEKRQKSDNILAEFQVASTGDEASLSGELHRYDEMNSTVGLKNNPLNFWESHRKVFPKLSEVATVILSVPTSQVGVECHFNIGKIIVNARRANIKPDKLDATCFVGKNYSIPKIDY